MDAITTQDLLSVPGIVALVLLIIQLAKPYLPERWTPLIAVGIGSVVGLGAALIAGQTTSEQLVDALLRGLVAGTSAVGVFQTIKPLNLLKTKSEQMTSKVAPRG